VLISADALWQDGFGVVFPELDGESAFDDVGAVLDEIERLDARWVIPGHGTPFTDVPGALHRARSRLDAFRADPDRHSRHAAKVLIKYHLLEEQRQSLARFHLWAGDTPYLRATWERLRCPDQSLHAWCDRLLGELSVAQAARVADGWVANA
jgi:glyoxylase-like metal-dependent hydrolase (beta-lactamase superfamily II)